MGFAQELKMNFEHGLIRNHYVGRTFIEPSQKIRSLGVKLKLNANQTTIKDKKIILIDDSLVRGTTSYKIVKMLYDCLLYTSPSPRDRSLSRMPSSA